MNWNATILLADEITKRSRAGCIRPHALPPTPRRARRTNPARARIGWALVGIGLRLAVTGRHAPRVGTAC